MKLQDISAGLAAAATLFSVFGFQHVQAEQAACCSDFDPECYTVNNTRSNDYACSSNSPPPCSRYCRLDGTSADNESCKACCVTFPQHATPWECELDTISCFAEEYGVGNYSDYHRENYFTCPQADGEAGFGVALTADTVEQCLSACESTGIPGCCSFEEIVDPDQNITTISDCKFESVDGETFAELRNSTGSEPYILLERRLVNVVPNTDHYYRGVRCAKTSSQTTNAPGGTDAPSTDEPTSPGTTSGAAQVGATVAVFVGVGAALISL